MSRRTRKPQTQNTQHEEDDIPTQHTQDENFKDNMNKCVRYIIYRSGTNEPIKKNELKKNVLTNVGKNYDGIINKVAHVLDKTYGFKLTTCVEGANVFYVISQNIDNHKDIYDDTEEVPEDINKVLIMLVLTNIFMSTKPVNEASMLIFLSTLGINVENDRGIFENVKNFINTSMVKQNYIALETNPLSKEVTYIWGSRSENTISKLSILQFVSKIYGDKQPSSWASQYEEANTQSMNEGIGE